VRESPVPARERQEQEKRGRHSVREQPPARARRRAPSLARRQREPHGHEQHRQLERALRADRRDQPEAGADRPQRGPERVHGVGQGDARAGPPSASRQQADHRREGQTESERRWQDQGKGLQSAGRHEVRVGHPEGAHEQDLGRRQPVEERDGHPHAQRRDQEARPQERRRRRAAGREAGVRRTAEEEPGQVGAEDERESVDLRAEEDPEMPRPRRFEAQGRERREEETGQERPRERGAPGCRLRRDAAGVAGVAGQLGPARDGGRVPHAGATRVDPGAGSRRQVCRRRHGERARDPQLREEEERQRESPDRRAGRVGRIRAGRGGPGRGGILLPRRRAPFPPARRGLPQQVHHQRKGPAHERRRHHDQEERDCEAEREEFRRIPRRRGVRAGIERGSPLEQSVGDEAVHADAGLDEDIGQRQPAQPVGDPAEDPGPEPQAEKVRRQERGRRGGRRTEDVPQHPEPEELVDERRRAGQEERRGYQGEERQERPAARVPSRTSLPSPWGRGAPCVAGRLAFGGSHSVSPPRVRGCALARKLSDGRGRPAGRSARSTGSGRRLPPARRCEP